MKTVSLIGAASEEHLRKPCSFPRSLCSWCDKAAWPCAHIYHSNLQCTCSQQYSCIHSVSLVSFIQNTVYKALALIELHVPQYNTLPNHAMSGDMKHAAHGLIQHTKALGWWFVSLGLYPYQAIASCQIKFNVSSLHLGKADRGRIPVIKCTWCGSDSTILLMPPSRVSFF